MSVNILLGKTIQKIETRDYDGVGVDINGDIRSLIFTLDTGKQYSMYHSQDCCETVRLQDISGNLNDLIGSPILKAEEVVSNDDHSNDPSDYTEGYDDSHTWTFYHFATINGYVTLRWLGESNGYYSESVDFCEI